MANDVKQYWPDDLKGFCIGNEGFLLVQFEDESKPVEIDTAKDVTVNFTTTTVDTSLSLIHI